MDCTFEEYIEDVKSQLCCNNDDDVDYITYDYTEQQIYDEIKHFEDCWKRNISGYKALLFFFDYLQDQANPIEDTTTR